MRVDGGLILGDMAGVPERVRALEAAGYDGAVTAEISSDPFLPLALAAEHSERVDLMTSIAVAFSRNPMLLAQIGHDLNAFSKGRFILGLGSQIRPHITKRFSMPWSHPAARMREFILAIRAIWDTWYGGKPLAFRGEFYTHTLMTPMFTPLNTEHGAARIFLAAVGPRMTETAGEVADGLIAHAFTTDRYLREVTIPAIERGLAKSGRSRESFQISCPIFVASGETEEAFRASVDATRKQISFYASTPAYRGVLELHGWGDAGPELTRLSKEGKWDAMADVIDDSMLGTFAVVGEPDAVIPALRARCEGVIDRVLFTVPGSGEDEKRRLEALRA